VISPDLTQAIIRPTTRTVCLWQPGKKVPGLMKDENNGAIMTEFIGLRAKTYALRVDGKKNTKKAKGVKNSVVTRTFDDYTQCLNEEIEMTRCQLYKIKVAQRVYIVQDEDRSESIQRQVIYRARFDRDATVRTLADTFIIFCVLCFLHCTCIF